MARWARVAAARGCLLWLGIIATIPALSAGPAVAQTDAGSAAWTVLTSDIEGEVITPVIADFLIEGIARAEAQGATAYVIELDTPGGLDTSMRKIVQGFLESEVPIVVFVPPGARAASAGAIIGMSAHILAMGPGSAIGAATPVDLQGGDIGRKIINDAAAYAEDLARARGRDVTFAVEAVRKGRSVSSAEALDIGVIDLIASDLEDVLAQIDGRSVETADGAVTLDTADALRTEHSLSTLQRVRQRLADPNLAFIFLSLGTLALVYEFANPGLGAGGVTGVILIILGMFALSVLPVNTAGAALLVLALALFVGEVFTAGLGVFAAGGMAALILGGLFLFRGSVGVSLAAIIPVALVVGGGVILAGRLAWRARSAQPSSGVEGLVGQRTTVRRLEGDVAQVFVEGAWWRVRSDDDLAVGSEVTILGTEGLDLIVGTAHAPEGEQL